MPLLGVLAAGQSCQGGVPVVDPPLHLDAGLLVDSGRTSISDVVTIDSGCAISTDRGKLRSSNILFVIDRSGSMACNPPEDGQSTESCATFPVKLFPALPSKWDLARSAIESAVDELRTAGTVRLGLSMFPKDGSLCTVTTEPDIPIATLDTVQLGKVTSALEQTQPFGETPLAGATILGYAHLLERMRKGELDGQTFVVLVTDGYETCKRDEIQKLLNNDVPNALHLLGVRTFVIGAPGSENGRAFLSEIAVAGGTEADPKCTFGPNADQGNCHYDMTETLDFSADLLAALTKVNAEVLACTVDIPKPPAGGAVNLEEVNVLVNGESRPMKNVGACSKTDGWRYSSDLSSIELCGNTCRAAKQPGAEVTVILGCPTLIQ